LDLVEWDADRRPQTGNRAKQIFKGAKSKHSKVTYRHLPFTKRVSMGGILDEHLNLAFLCVRMQKLLKLDIAHSIRQNNDAIPI
jgi:hypothetical protein